jgi:hypothetical protein
MTQREHAVGSRQGSSARRASSSQERTAPPRCSSSSGAIDSPVRTPVVIAKASCNSKKEALVGTPRPRQSLIPASTSCPAEGLDAPRAMNVEEQKRPRWPARGRRAPSTRGSLPGPQRAMEIRASSSRTRSQARRRSRSRARAPARCEDRRRSDLPVDHPLAALLCAAPKRIPGGACGSAHDNIPPADAPVTGYVSAFHP